MKYEEIIELVKIGEGYTIEFKESLSNSIGKEICAFANASGGKIIIGVKDNGQIIGIQLTNSQKSLIQDIARNMDPSFQVDIEKRNGKFDFVRADSISQGSKIKRACQKGQCAQRD